MKINYFALTILLLIGIVANAQVSSRKMAITIDDLPYVGGGPDQLKKAQRATTEILSVLQKHKVQAVGFVNEGKLMSRGEVDERIALLQQWVDAGMVLGNHTFSHADLNALTIEQYQDDIIKGEVITRRLMQPHQPYQLYFRNPYTRTGDTEVKKVAIENFLKSREYVLTPHTFENSDFIFNVGYGNALKNKDEVTAKKIKDEYLKLTDMSAEFAERASKYVFGREIPQILLIHTNDITADSLDEMLTRLAARGYSFISLDDAMKDEACQTKVTVVSKTGPSWLFRWAKSIGMDVGIFKEEPGVVGWVMDMYKQK